MGKDELLKWLANEHAKAARACRPAACIELLKQIIILDPKSNVWKDLYADRLRQLGAYDEAERLLVELYVTKYRVGDVAVSLGRLFDDRGVLDRAEYWYKEATIANPDHASPWIFYGSVLARLARFTDAIAAFERATNAKDGNIDEAYLNLGLVYRALSNYQQSMKYLKLAIQISPEYPIARAALADVEHAAAIRREKFKRDHHQ